MGLPEARINLAQAAISLALARKDRVIYDAINAAMEEVKNTGAVPVVLGALPDGLKVRSFFRPGPLFQSSAKENTRDKR